jgi:hypothetical protein
MTGPDAERGPRQALVQSTQVGGAQHDLTADLSRRIDACVSFAVAATLGQVRDDDAVRWSFLRLLERCSRDAALLAAHERDAERRAVTR